MRHHLAIGAVLAAAATASAGCDKSGRVIADPAPTPASQPTVAAAPTDDGGTAASPPPPVLTGKALDRARRKSASNLHQIGLAILLYQGDHAQQYPPDLGVLVAAENIGLEAFINPATGHAPPPKGTAMSAEDRAAWVNDSGDYGYVRPAGANPPASRVVCYEKTDGDAAAEGLTVLYGDGHAEFVPTAVAERRIADAQRAAGRP